MITQTAVCKVKIKSVIPPYTSVWNTCYLWWEIVSFKLIILLVVCLQGILTKAIHFQYHESRLEQFCGSLVLSSVVNVSAKKQKLICLAQKWVLWVKWWRISFWLLWYTNTKQAGRVFCYASFVFLSQSTLSGLFCSSFAECSWEYSLKPVIMGTQSALPTLWGTKEVFFCSSGFDKFFLFQRIFSYLLQDVPKKVYFRKLAYPRLLAMVYVDVSSTQKYPQFDS